MSTTTYRRMDVVMVKADYTDDWHLGIVTHDFNEGDHWIQAEAKTDECSTSIACPGHAPNEVRPATDDDIAAAPDYARSWLQREREREEQRLLEQRDPTVRANTVRGNRALRAAGINRVSDLARFTDKELLALDGIGRAAIKVWRFKQQLQQQEVQANG